MAASVFIGLAAPPLASLARPFILPLLLSVLTVAMVRIDWRAVAAYGRRPLLIGPVLAWLLLAAPVAVWLIVAGLGLPGPLAAALVLTAAAPPITGAATLALLFGLDAPLALVALVLGTLLTPLTLPLIAFGLLGFELEIGLLELMARLGAMIGGVVVAALIWRRLAPTGWIDRNLLALDGAQMVLMSLFAVGIMDGVTELALTRPGYAAFCLGAAFAANLVLQVLGALPFLAVGWRRALAIGLVSGYRNMALVLTALAGGAPFDLLVFFAIGQMPIFLVPAITAPLYRRFLPRP